MGALVELLTFVGTMLVGSALWWLLSPDGGDDGGGGDGPEGPRLLPMTPCACAVSASASKRHPRRCHVGRPKVVVPVGRTAPSRSERTRI
jgi:hypothetical protein